VTDTAAAHRFFHWQIECPEVFFTPSGTPRPDAGFDAVIGNPPWETLRGDEGDKSHRSGARASARALTHFARASGCYRWQADGHANLYQLFAERMLRLARPGGRVGLLMPSGLVSDHGSRRLREALLETCRVDAIMSFENRDAIFPIHRGMRFVLLTASIGGNTTELPMCGGLRAAATLDDVPDEGPLPGAVRVPVTLIRRFSGDTLAVPELRTETDRAIVARITAGAPPLGSPEGWHARFGRELNASDDRRHFGPSGLPVIEGKHLGPFRVTVPADAHRIEAGVAARVLGASRFARPRLGYREVASATNRLTLIAAIVPAGVVTSHTVFCLKSEAPEDVHWFLCGVCNSYVANYLVRIRGGTHVPASTLQQLPVPCPSTRDPRFGRVVDLARRMSARPRTDAAGAPAELQAIVAELYDVSRDEFDHILSTFPLVPPDARHEARVAFCRMRDAI
jgi:hypothetical protein